MCLQFGKTGEKDWTMIAFEIFNLRMKNLQLPSDEDGPTCSKYEDSAEYSAT